MKLDEIQTCKCTPQLNIPFSTCWSDDNYIAMATEKGVYTTEFLPSSNNTKATMGLVRHFFEPSHYLPTSDCKIEVDELFKSLNHTDLMRLAIDDTMSPRIKGTPFTVTVRQLGWAKFDFPDEPRSFLTVLTNGGSLSLYKIKGNDWIEIINISKVWYDRSTPLWKPLVEGSNEERLRTLRERSYRLKITAFAWTGPKSTSNLLFTGSMDGTICAWEVSRSQNSGQLELELLRGLETDQEIISSLTIIQTDVNRCLLVYAISNGRIFAIPVSITDVVEFHEPSDIWDENDGLAVSPGGLQAEIVLGYVVLAAAKGPHLAVFLITSDGQLLSNATMNLGDIAITGLYFVSSTEIFLTTWNGKVASISVTVDSDASIKLSSSRIESPIKTDNMGIMGVAFSKTKTIIVLAFSVKVPFNHIIVRECSSMVFCTLPELSNPLSIIKSHSGPLCTIWDAIEVARIKFMKNSDKNYKMLNSLVDLDHFDTMHLTQLQKNLFFLNSLLNSLSGEEEEKKNFVDLGMQIYDLITAHHVFKRAAMLMAQKVKSSEAQASLMLIKRWIEHFESNLDTDNFPSTYGILSVILEQLKACEFITMNEYCAICGAGPEDDVPTGIKNWRCTEKHEIPRCSISFLQCVTLPYYVCRSCDIIVHPYAVERESYSLCIYCDGFLQKQENVLE